MNRHVNHLFSKFPHFRGFEENFSYAKDKFIIEYMADETKKHRKLYKQYKEKLKEIEDFKKKNELLKKQGKKQKNLINIE